MNAERFADAARSLMPHPSRRFVARALAGMTFAGTMRSPIGLMNAEAKRKKKKKKPCGPCRIRKKGKCKGNQADGTACPGGTCANGGCAKPDASCRGGPGIVYDPRQGNDRVAQTFAPLASGQLVSTQMAVLHAASDGGEYVQHLSPLDLLGVPTNTVLATGVLTGDELPEGPATLTFTFLDPFSVVAGVEYALVLARPGSTQMQVAGFEDDTCAGRAFLSPTETLPFQESPFVSDYVFATVIRP